MADLVALTTSIEPRGGDYSKPQLRIYASYLQLLQRVGLTPVLITPAHEPDHIRALVRRCAGFVLSGGEDVEPWRYGEEPVAELDEINPIRDEMELAALAEALAHGCPVLAICRGMQLLNVHLGGTLYQDLPTQWESAVNHDQKAPWGRPQHGVACEPGSRLHGILGPSEPVRLNSFHHQAVKGLAPELVTTARAEDGLIEGVELSTHDWVVGVQWHPERCAPDAPETDPNVRLLAAFADRVRSWASTTVLAAPGSGPTTAAP